MYAWLIFFQYNVQKAIIFFVYYFRLIKINEVKLLCIYLKVMDYPSVRT